MVFHLIKAGKSSFCSIHCSLEPSVSIPALLFFFPLQNANQAKQTQACLGGSAISSILCSLQELEKRFWWWQKWFLAGPHLFFSPTLGCLLMCCGLEVRASHSSLVNVCDRAAILNPKGGFENGSSLPYATAMKRICIFSLFIWGLARVLSSFEERPFGVGFCFSVLVFPGSESAERKPGLMCVSFPAKWSVWEND